MRVKATNKSKKHLRGQANRRSQNKLRLKQING